MLIKKYIKFTSGDVPIIRVWDVERSLSIQDIPSGSDTSCITSLVNIFLIIYNEIEKLILILIIKRRITRGDRE